MNTNVMFSSKTDLWETPQNLFDKYDAIYRFATVVMLLPARTDTKWFHDWCLPYGKIEFLRGRLKFGGCNNSAPFPSMIVIFKADTKEVLANG